MRSLHPAPPLKATREKQSTGSSHSSEDPAQPKSEFNLEAWGKETSNIISLKKNEKAEKYYINEGTN